MKIITTDESTFHEYSGTWTSTAWWATYRNYYLFGRFIFRIKIRESSMP